MNERSLFAHHHTLSNWAFDDNGQGHDDNEQGYENSGPLIGPDGQPMLAMVGDLGDTLVGSSSASIGGSDSGATSSSPPTGSNAGLVINVSYDQAQSSLPSGFVAAVNYVVNYFEGVFTTPTTVNIDIGYGEIGGQVMGSNALGESESYLGAYSYSVIKTALAKSDPSAAASLPATQPVSGTMWVPSSEAKALGLSTGQSTTALDGYVGISSTLPFTYDPNNRAVAGDYDFIGVLEHEFTEVMGRIDLFGETLGGTAAYSLLDMFHYASSGIHTYTGTTPNYFSVDGGHTNLIAFNSSLGGDLGDWASSAGADSFLAFSPSGQAEGVSTADIITMNALGYQGALPQSPSTMIEALGSTALVQSGGHYFMNPVSDGTGPQVSDQAGAPLTVGEYGAWTPLGAEVTSTGYEVAWKNGSADQYSVWQTDSTGHFLSSSAIMSGSSSASETYETSFHQDLNGDGTVGVPGAGGGTGGTTVEALGSTALVQSSGHYFMNPVSGGTGSELSDLAGASLTVSEYGAWTPLGAEVTSTGYEVAWKNGSADQYSVWQTDSTGHFLSSSAIMSGSSSASETYETSFHQDLNGDGTVGVPGAGGGGGTGGTMVESFGATALVQSGGHYFMNPVSGGTGPQVSDQAGASLTVGEYGAWTPLGAEATSTGYEVAWKNGSADQYSVWQTDSSGHFLSSSAIMSGSSSASETYETSFHQDLNGDGTIGVPSSGGTIVAAQVPPTTTDEAPIIGLADTQHSDHG